jgi:peptidoglycan hydrolase-like protein with peptidoglycan-binding domain
MDKQAMLMKLEDIIAANKSLPIASADSDLIRQIQIRFRDLGLPVGEVDGEYGRNTAWCFSRFCKAFNQPDEKITSDIAKLLIETKQLPLLKADDSTFQFALKIVLEFEGGFSEDPQDKGGATNYGITHSEYDTWRRKHEQEPRDIRDISRDEVKAIYHDNYWDASSCHKMIDRVAICVFDWSVNAGVKQGIKTLQDCLEVESDGELGPVTEAALHKAIEQPNTESLLLKNYLARRIECYRRWGVNSQSVFLKGWLARVEKLRYFLGV